VANPLDSLIQAIKALPGLGNRSAERIAIHLLAERREKIPLLIETLQDAAAKIQRCTRCGNLCTGEICEICSDPARESEQLCIVESVSDLIALEKSGAWRGHYHVLNGKLSPIKGIGPEHLNLASLETRFADGTIREVLFALPNDIEGEATCHYIQEQLLPGNALTVSRIGFGLPSGGDIPYADVTTLRNALESRKGFA
jgi:recombination protein RecR